MIRSARDEAEARVDGRYEARVLEPSPPAVSDGPYFADDPAALGAPRGDRPVVSPTGDGDITWDELCASDGALAAWAAERWLGGYRRLEPLPPGFAATRDALHRLAVHVVAHARRAANGKIGLRHTLAGFGTPFFGDDEQVRVEGVDLVVERRDVRRREPIVTLAGGAALTGVPLDPASWRDLGDAPGAGDPSEVLAVDGACALALAEWYGFAASVLEQVRFELSGHGSSSRVQLWPEHFDMAFDHGAAGGVRANFGCSPGDGVHADPYVYVGPFEPQAGEFWNAPFGAVVGYSDLVGSSDQREAALAFLHEGAQRLRSP